MRISPQMFEKNPNDPNIIFRALGKMIYEKKTEAKISSFELTIRTFQHNLFHVSCGVIDIENNISHAQTWHNQAINCLYCIAGPPTGCRLNPASGSSQVPLPALEQIGSLARFYLNLNLPRKPGPRFLTPSNTRCKQKIRNLSCCKVTYACWELTRFLGQRKPLRIYQDVYFWWEWKG